MKRRTKQILAIGILVLLLIAASIPRVSDVRMVGAESISDYPALQAAYEEFCSTKTTYLMESADTIHIVTVRNLWGSWERYLLPSFGAKVSTVPQNGTVKAYAAFQVVSAWSDENILNQFFSLKAQDLGVTFHPEENTFVYQDAWLESQNRPVNSSEFLLKDITLYDNVDFVVNYDLQTAPAAQNEDEPSSAIFTWYYSLTILGREICTGEYSITQDYIVNA